MLSQLLSYLESWRRQIPLPATTGAVPSFQEWLTFDKGQWISPARTTDTIFGARHQWEGFFHLISWNVNADAAFPRSRISALLQAIRNTEVADILLLQEVSKEALVHLLEDPWIQQNWYTSDAGFASFGTQKFATITLLSKRWITSHNVSLGGLWRIHLPSRFGRDALCCDLVLNASSKCAPGKQALRIRLINVHLDSLPINPSLRPRQLSLAASYLSAAGRGMIAGDFNTVLPEDEDLISTNKLTDGWTHLYPEDSGFTWGLYTGNPFPPNRLDRVALLNLSPLTMTILKTHEVDGHGEMALDGSSESSDMKVPFSDHYGLLCKVKWAEDLQVPEQQGLESRESHKSNDSLIAA